MGYDGKSINELFTPEHIGALAAVLGPMNRRIDDFIEHQSVVNESARTVNESLRVMCGENAATNKRLELYLNHHQQECVARVELEGHLKEHKEIIRLAVAETVPEVMKKSAQRRFSTAQFVGICLSILIGIGTIGTGFVAVTQTMIRNLVTQEIQKTQGVNP